MHNIQDCLEQSGLSKEDIYSVEIVGGSSRIPSVKTLIEKVALPLYIYSVEIVGGSSRIPSLKTLIEKVAVPSYIYSVEILGSSSRPSVKTLI